MAKRRAGVQGRKGTSNFGGPSRPKAGPSVFQRTGAQKPGISSVKRVPTMRVNFSPVAPRESPHMGGPAPGGLAAAFNRGPRGGWRNGKSPSGFEAAMHTYTGNPPANIGSSDIYH